MTRWKCRDKRQITLAELKEDKEEKQYRTVPRKGKTQLVKEGRKHQPMKRKQQAKRLLSGLLAVGMCAGMVAPAAYAEEALPVAEPAAEQEGELPDNTVELPAETPAEEQPAEEQPVEEQPAEEQPAEEKSIEEQPIEEKPVEEQPAEEKTTAEEELQPVAEPAAEQPAAPTLAFGAEKWDPAQPGRFVLNGGSNAVDSVAMTLTGDAAARYDLRADGTIALEGRHQGGKRDPACDR